MEFDMSKNENDRPAVLRDKETNGGGRREAQPAVGRTYHYIILQDRGQHVSRSDSSAAAVRCRSCRRLHMSPRVIVAVVVALAWVLRLRLFPEKFEVKSQP